MHTYWYLGRSAGLVSYWLLWSSVVLGLAVTSRLLDGWLHRGWVFEFHRFLSLFVLIVILFHALIMLPDPYAGFTLRELLIPFASHLNSTAMSLGIVALYGAAILSASFWVRGLIGHRTWRLLHYLTFGVYLLALVHGLMNGTDTGNAQVKESLYLSLLVVVFFVLYRLLAARPAKTGARRHKVMVRSPGLRTAAGASSGAGFNRGSRAGGRWLPGEALETRDRTGSSVVAPRPNIERTTWQTPRTANRTEARRQP